MKLELPDNAREAFQFLAIGAGVVLAIRLAIALVVLIASTTEADPLIAAIANYRNGYALLDPHTLVVGGMAMMPRVAVAILSIVITALVSSTSGSLISTLIRRSAIKGAVLGARIGMVLSTGWVIYALLALPPVSVQVGAHGLTVVERYSFLGALSYPLGWDERVINWSDVEIIADQAETDSSMRNKAQVVMVSSGTEWIRIAQLMDGFLRSDTGSLDADNEAQRLIEQLTVLQASAAR